MIKLYSNEGKLYSNRKECSGINPRGSRKYEKVHELQKFSMSVGDRDNGGERD